MRDLSRIRMIGMFLCWAAALVGLPGVAQAHDFAFGADVSSLAQLEQRGTVMADTNGTTMPVLVMLKNHGYNWVRLRVCVPPAQLPQTTEYTIAAARDARKLGYKFLLDIHYSNAWADPTNEPTPSTWRGLSQADREKALYDYTRQTIAAMKVAGVMPDMVQVGNEIGNGMLWPSGKLPEGWDNLAAYIKGGIRGVKDGAGDGPTPKIMLHVDHGGNLLKCKNFFYTIQTYGIEFDAIGLSFYPWSHGTLVDLRQNLEFCAKRYGKPIYVVETGYHYAPSRYFAESAGPFPESPDGQKAWLQAVTDVVLQTRDGLGKGVFWWEPTQGRGGMSARSYFGPGGVAQPVIEAFDKYTRPLHRTDGQDDGAWYLKDDSKK